MYDLAFRWYQWYVSMESVLTDGMKMHVSSKNDGVEGEGRVTSVTQFHDEVRNSKTNKERTKGHFFPSQPMLKVLLET